VNSFVALQLQLRLQPQAHLRLNLQSERQRIQASSCYASYLKFPTLPVMLLLFVHLCPQ
jgi:hypothetical protein